MLGLIPGLREFKEYKCLTKDLVSKMPSSLQRGTLQEVDTALWGSVTAPSKPSGAGGQPSGSLCPAHPLLGEHPLPRLHTLGMGAGRLDLLDSCFRACDFGTSWPQRLVEGNPVQGDSRHCMGDVK